MVKEVKGTKVIKDLFHIADVNIDLIKPQDGLIGFASLVLFESLYLSSIGIHKKLDGSGYRLTYPRKEGTYKDFETYYPLKPELSKSIEEAVFTKIKELLEEE